MTQRRKRHGRLTLAPGEQSSDPDDDQQLETLRRTMLPMDATPLKPFYLFRAIHNYDGIGDMACRGGGCVEWRGEWRGGTRRATAAAAAAAKVDGRWGDPPHRAMKRAEGKTWPFGRGQTGQVPGRRLVHGLVWYGMVLSWQVSAEPCVRGAEAGVEDGCDATQDQTRPDQT